MTVSSKSLFGDILFEWETFGWGLQSFASIGVVALLVALVCFLIVVRSLPTDRAASSVFGALLVVALFGGLVGFHGGNSRVGVVGDLIPAVVTLLAGLAAYVFGLPDKKPGPFLFPMLGSFIVTLFLSWSIGAANHSGNETYAEWEAQCLSVLGHPEVLASDTAYRNALIEFGEYCDGAFRKIQPSDGGA